MMGFEKGDKVKYYRRGGQEVRGVVQRSGTHLTQVIEDGRDLTFHWHDNLTLIQKKESDDMEHEFKVGDVVEVSDAVKARRGDDMRGRGVVLEITRDGCMVKISWSNVVRRVCEHQPHNLKLVKSGHGVELDSALATAERTTTYLRQYREDGSKDTLEIAECVSRNCTKQISIIRDNLRTDEYDAIDRANAERMERLRKKREANKAAQLQEAHERTQIFLKKQADSSRRVHEERIATEAAEKAVEEYKRNERLEAEVVRREHSEHT